MNLHVISTAILIGHWLIVVGLSFRVVMRRPPVGVALAWLAVVFSLPFAGALLYILFGEKRLGSQRETRIRSGLADFRQRQQGLAARHSARSGELSVGAEPLARQAEAALGLAPLRDNDLELLQDFATFVDRLNRDIDAAQQSIHLCFYIWQEGGRVGDVIEALLRAARRGVHCRVLVDAVGSATFLRSGCLARLRDAGVELETALPTGLRRTLVARTDLRNHRKVIVIDGWIAYAGSQNMADPGHFRLQAGVGQWVDAIARIVGPAAASLEGLFRLDWNVEGGAPLPTESLPTIGQTLDSRAVVQVVPSGPEMQPETLHRLLLTAIYSARRELVITTPYFVPDDAIETALIAAAQRGVRVTLVIPARIDSVLVRHASAAYFDELLSAGVEIALFDGGLLHTKSLTIDGDISIFGSVNLDMRSLWLNFEISLLIFDRPFTASLRRLQADYLEHSKLLAEDTWRRSTTASRLLANACRLLAPLL
jgi:cardiolipin synthase